MKEIVLVGICVLAGCSSQSTLAELEEQAYLTGDWSAVERRERSMARRAAQSGLQCGSGLVRYCESYIGQKRCSCIDNDSMRDMFVRR